MIQTFSSTIRRKEMDAVLTCMVDEKIGPGELNGRLIQAVKDVTGCDGAVALRSPALALSYALRALALEAGSAIMLSALAPSWQYQAVEQLGYKPMVLDVAEETGLVTAAAVEAGAQAGGRLLLLHETMGIMPDMDAICALGIPVIEDIAHSVGAVVAASVSADGGETAAAGRKAGSFGVYTLLGLEEFDTVTAGGGAVLMAPRRREWIVLKKLADAAPRTDILPDINSALAWIQLKEYSRNEEMRKKLFAVFQHALMSGRNKTFVRESDGGSTIWSFPVVLSGSFKDAKQYASRKEIEIKSAYADSVIALKEEELSPSCMHAKSLFLRTALFPLYPRLTNDAATKIAKVLGTLP